MHDYSIKLLAVVEGPRELGDDDDDDDDSPHCQLTTGYGAWRSLTAGGDKSAEKKKKKKNTKTRKNIRRDISDDLLKNDISEITSSFFIYSKLWSLTMECMGSFYVICDPILFSCIWLLKTVSRRKAVINKFHRYLKLVSSALNPVSL